MFRRIFNWLRDLVIPRPNPLGMPKPIGPNKTIVWAGWLPGIPEEDGDVNVLVGFLVTAGTAMSPVAFVQGSGDDPIITVTREDFRIARRIARKVDRAKHKSDYVLDLRLWDPYRGEEHAFLRDLEMSPLDRRGKAIIPKAPRQPTRFRFAPPPEIWNCTPIPCFDLEDNGGWGKAPDDLKNHLDKIDPANKNSGQVATDTLSPGQSESEAATLTAA